VTIDVTAHAPVIVTLQAGPDQPANVPPDAGVAVSVTVVPGVKSAAQVPGQEMPAGLLLTLPAVPVSDTVRLFGGATKVKVAVTLVSWLIATVHDPVPEHPTPDQPVNAELSPG
jgi:hypothetical protein